MTSKNGPSIPTEQPQTDLESNVSNTSALLTSPVPNFKDVGARIVSESESYSENSFDQDATYDSLEDQKQPDKLTNNRSLSSMLLSFSEERINRPEIGHFSGITPTRNSEKHTDQTLTTTHMIILQ